MTHPVIEKMARAMHDAQQAAMEKTIGNVLRPHSQRELEQIAATAALRALLEPTEDMVEAATRLVCSKALGGFCQSVGGDLGCRNGRGDSGPHLCVATSQQFWTMWEGDVGRVILPAMILSILNTDAEGV